MDRTDVSRISQRGTDPAAKEQVPLESEAAKPAPAGRTPSGKEVRSAPSISSLTEPVASARPYTAEDAPAAEKPRLRQRGAKRKGRPAGEASPAKTSGTTPEDAEPQDHTPVRLNKYKQYPPSPERESKAGNAGPSAFDASAAADLWGSGPVAHPAWQEAPQEIQSFPMEPTEYAELTGSPPARLDVATLQHICIGDSGTTGGGHMDTPENRKKNALATGQAKTIFPSGWNQEKIEQAVLAVVKTPDVWCVKVRRADARHFNTIRCCGTYEGIQITVVRQRRTRGGMTSWPVTTAFPTPAEPAKAQAPAGATSPGAAKKLETPK